MLTAARLLRTPGEPSRLPRYLSSRTAQWTLLQHADKHVARPGCDLRPRFAAGLYSPPLRRRGAFDAGDSHSKLSRAHLPYKDMHLARKYLPCRRGVIPQLIKNALNDFLHSSIELN